MRSESPYDPFGAGHASTSVASALGMALARDLVGSDETVVAVLGDGALTGGLAYEALNNAGALRSPFIVILKRQRNVDCAERWIDRRLSFGSAHQNRLQTSSGEPGRKCSSAFHWDGSEACD